MVNLNLVDVSVALLELLDVTLLHELEEWTNHHLQKIVPHQFSLLGTLDTNSPDRIFVTRSINSNNTKEYCNNIIGKKGIVSCPNLKKWIKEYCHQHKEECSICCKLCDNFSNMREHMNNITHGCRCISGSLCSFISLYGLPESKLDSYKKIVKLIAPHVHQTLARLPAEAATQTSKQKTFTTRESEIVRWIRHGKTNWEIAGILGISDKTVKTHVQNLLSKFDVKSRSQLVGLSR